ncbi:MAG: hypothetical protein HC927_11525 [Deltaproteobacteria bacterium]|nr:hypothetical protein [Deltaproteobacteria bacterium]
MNEREILDAGPASVISAASRLSPGVNFHALALACGRKARQSSASDAAILWTKAAVACYGVEARRLPPGLVRQSAQAPAFGLEVMLILRFGKEGDVGQGILRSIRSWLSEGMKPFDDAASFLRALEHAHSEDVLREHALVLRERLQVASALWRAGEFSELSEWFHGVGEVS